MKPQKVTDALSMPLGPHLQVLGNRQIKAEGVTGLLAIEKNCIRLRMGRQVTEIRGEHLRIVRMNPAGTLVEGNITEILLQTPERGKDR